MHNISYFCRFFRKNAAVEAATIRLNKKEIK